MLEFHLPYFVVFDELPTLLESRFANFFDGAIFSDAYLLMVIYHKIVDFTLWCVWLALATPLQDTARNFNVNETKLRNLIANYTRKRCYIRTQLHSNGKAACGTATLKTNRNTDISSDCET